MRPRFPGGVLGELLSLIGVYIGGVRPPDAAEERPRYAVVLGTQVLPGGRPSRTLDARVRHAARLYAEGRIGRVVVTGGVGKHPPSEAEVMARILREEGVPEGDVLLEDEAESTWDSARLVAALVAEEGVSEVLVVTDPLHCVRTAAGRTRSALRTPAGCYHTSAPPSTAACGPRGGVCARSMGSSTSRRRSFEALGTRTSS